MKRFKTIQLSILAQSKDKQFLLNQMYTIIKAEAATATEVIV